MAGPGPSQAPDDLPDDGVIEPDLDELFADLSPPPGQTAASPAKRPTGRQRDLQEELDAVLRGRPAELVIADDRLSAWLTRVDPGTTSEVIVALLRRHNVCYGVDQAAVRQALARAAGGRVLREVVVARGTAPRVLQPARTECRPDLSSSRVLDRLKALFEAPAVAPEGWSEPVCLVASGERLAERFPAVVEAGRDVLGGPVGLLAEVIGPWGGDHTEVTADGRRCLASIYGYAGIADGSPTVLSPLWVAPDRMEVRWVHLPTSSAVRPPTLEELHQLLRLSWIEFGLLEDQLALLTARVGRGLAPGAHAVARGKPARPGRDGLVELAFPGEGPLSHGQLLHLFSAPEAGALRAAIREAAEANAEIPLGAAVKPGALLAERVPPTPGEPGRDVEGELIPASDGRETALAVGDGVRLGEDGQRCFAVQFGWACLRLDQVHVVSPIWIAPDRSAAYYVNLPQARPALFPEPEELQAALEQAGVTHGLDPDHWRSLLPALRSGRERDPLISVAQATQATPGRDASFEWAVEMEGSRVGKVLEDGSVDFRERHLTTGVHEGELIGVLVPAVEGTPGTDVTGRPIQPSRPLNTEVVTDPRVTARPVERGTGFFAASGGGVTRQIEEHRSGQRVRQRIRLGISPVSNVDGDVDYSTGNIDFHGDVVIRGSVQPLFTVKATGSVAIGGYVEAGAFVAAGGDLTVKGGVVGAATELVAHGSVFAKFIQEASVRAGGEVQAGAYIYNASVRARGRVVVMGKGEGKSRALVGGLVWAGAGVEASSIGSPYTSSTRVVAGVDPDRLSRMDQLRANVGACEERQRLLMERYGLDSLEPEALRLRLQRARSPAVRQALGTGLKRIARIVVLRDSQRRELEELAEGQRQLSRRAEVTVWNRLFAGVEIRLGEQTLTVMDDRDRVRLRLVQKDEGLEVEIGPARG